MADKTIFSDCLN